MSWRGRRLSQGSCGALTLFQEREAPPWIDTAENLWLERFVNISPLQEKSHLLRLRHYSPLPPPPVVHPPLRLPAWISGAPPPLPHWTACSLAVLPESCGFMTSGSSGGVEKGSTLSCSNVSSGRRTGNGEKADDNSRSRRRWKTHRSGGRPSPPWRGPEVVPSGWWSHSSLTSVRRSATSRPGETAAGWCSDSQSQKLWVFTDKQRQAWPEPEFYRPQVFPKSPIYLVKPLILRWPLQNSFHDALQLINCGGLFGIGEDGRLMTSNHKKHILDADQQQEEVRSSFFLFGISAKTAKSLKIHPSCCLCSKAFTAWCERGFSLGGGTLWLLL